MTTTTVASSVVIVGPKPRVSEFLVGGWLVDVGKGEQESGWVAVSSSAVGRSYDGDGAGSDGQQQ